MRRHSAFALGAALAAALAAAVPAAPAAGQAVALPAPLAATDLAVMQVRASGRVAIEWEADPATCESVGRCGMRGTTTWPAPRDGLLLLVSQGRARQASLILASDDEAGGALATRVRTGSRLCADVADASSFAPLRVTAGQVEFSLAGAGALAPTRCAGPLAADLATALPGVRVPYGRVARGRLTVPLEGGGSFAAAGLRGSVTSTLRLRLRRPFSDDEVEAGSEGPRRRYVQSRFRVAAVRGDVPVELDAGPLGSWPCAALDACGLAGTQRLVPALDAGRVELLAYGRARRSARALRAAVGLAPGGVPRRVGVFGAGAFEGPGRIETTIGRPDERPCTDTAPLAGLTLLLEPHGRSVTARYGPEGPLRTRCPGPFLQHVQGYGSVEVPLRAFGRRRVELRFTRPRRFRDEGWTATARPALTVVLERTAVVEGLFPGG